MSRSAGAGSWSPARRAAGRWVLRALEGAAALPAPASRWIGRRVAALVARVGAPLEVEPGRALFLWIPEGPASAEVRLAGDWTGWRPSILLTEAPGTGVYTAQVPLPRDAYVGYKLVVGGDWRFDPLNPLKVGAGMGMSNSLLTLPGFSIPSALAGPAASGRGSVRELGVIEADGLPGGRRVRVYLPPGHDPLRRYPTLYVQDGDENLTRGEVPAALDRMVAAGYPPVIAVFIDHPGAERHVDYTPYFDDSRLAAYGDFLALSLCPRIEERFGASPDRAHRILWGQSFGGTCVMAVAHAHPTVFGRVAAQSGVFRWDGAEGVVDRYVDPPPPDTRFYLDSTHFGMEPSQSQAMADALRRLGAEHVYWRRGTNHSYEGWRFWLPSMFDFLLR